MKPKRKNLHFADYPEFQPNVTPEEMFEAGVFGGTYWRPIKSGVTAKSYKNKHLEFPWLKRIPEHMLTSSKCDKNVNKYKVTSGTSLDYWENKGWIKPQDPYGWVQWYCRFYQGRRSADDERQIKRWLAFAGPKGRFRLRLINMIKEKGKKYNDVSISPVIRQGLLQWAYELNKKDFSR